MDVPLRVQDAPDVNVICLGGHLRDISQGFEGPITEAALEGLTFDAVFLGCDGVTADRGICEATVAQTRLKELMWRASDRAYVLENGAVALEGRGADLLNDPRVREAYLGL